jgi:hypothetical protein
MCPTRKARFKRHYLGFRPWTRHSLVLVVAGTVYILTGFVWLNASTGGPTWSSLDLARNWLSLDGWGYVWITVGVVSMFSALWPPKVETWGYMALTGLAVAWGVFYILGFYTEKDSSIGMLANGGAWLLVAFLWWAISGLVSPEQIRGGERGRR